MLVPGPKINIFSRLAAAKKGVKTIIEQKRSSLDLRPFSVQLTRLDSMEYLDLTIAEESRRTESSLCAILGKTFGEEAVLSALVPKKSVAQPVGSIKVGHKAGVGEDKNKSLVDKIQENTNEVICSEKIKNDQNDLDERTTSVGSKGSDKVASDIKTDLDNLYDEMNV